MKNSPPFAAIRPTELTKHGQIRIDNYYWLNQRNNPEVLEYLTSENNYLESELKHTVELRESVFNEMVGRIRKEDVSVPYFKNGYHYYTRYEEEGEYPVYCRKKDIVDGEEEILLNGNELASGHAYFHIGGLSVSPDNNWLAYGIDCTGRRLYSIHIRNLVSGEELEETIPNTNASIAWQSDTNAFFYALKDENTLRDFRIMKHLSGTAPESDQVIFTESDEAFVCDVYSSRSREFIFIGSYSTMSTEYRFCSADDPSAGFKIFHPRESKHEYFPDHAGDTFYIRTNWKARNFRLMEVGVDNPGKERWKEIVGNEEDTFLEDFLVFQNHIVLQKRRYAMPLLTILQDDGINQHDISFDEEAYVLSFGNNPEVTTSTLRFTYTSLTTPESTFDYDMISGDRELLKQKEVVGGYDSGSYHSQRFMVEARDGIEVPVSLVYKKDKKLEGGNPLLLYAYGSYGISTEPYFNAARLSLLDRGFVFAIAHIRGGQEMGRWWYEDGKLLKKKNTFNDFIDCANYLIEQGFTTSGKLFALGGSAGGLLMGAVANMDPSVFKGMVAMVPFVDVITTMLDDSIPLTTGEYDEWGNPNVKEYYDYMLSYSPYDNIENKEYPALLITAGLHDSQVQYWEPAKWVARLRVMKKDHNKLFLHTNMEAGHGGASGRFETYRETALVYAFLIDLADNA